ESLHDRMLAAPMYGELLPRIGEEYGAIGLLPDQLLVMKALQRLHHRRVRNPQALGDVGAARFAALLEEFGNQFHVVLGELGLVVRAGAPEGGRTAPGEARFAYGHPGNIP